MRMAERDPSFLADAIQRCKEYRARHNLSQDDLGVLIGRSRSSIQNFESGKGLPTVKEFDKLMELISSDDAALALRLRALAVTIESPSVSKKKKERELKRFVNTYIGVVGGGVEKGSQNAV